MSTVTNPIPFNPDEWLAKNTSAPVAETLPTPLTPPTAQPSGFDPDAWLSKQVAAPPIAAPAMPEDAKFTNLMDIDTIIGNAAKLNGLDPKLVRSVIQQESGGNPTAKSPKGAQGLMQLMPETAKELGVTNPNDPNENVMGGTKYLSQQLKAFGGDVDLALAAYNWGPGNVSKRLRKGMTKEQILASAPEETKGYVARIRQMMEREGRIAATTENMRQSGVMNTPIVGPALTGMGLAAAELKGVGERLTDFAGVTDRSTNQSAEDALIASEAFARAQPGMLPQTVSGVTRSLTNMAPAIGVGMVNPIAGAALAAGMPAVTTYSATEQATGDTGHAIRQGLIEGGITGAMQAIGLGGLEKAASKGFRIGLKALGIDTLAELGEENAIQVLQNVDRWYTNNFDPEKKMTVTEALEGTKQATIQTLTTMGVVRGGQAAASRVLGRPVGVDQGEPDVPPAVAPTEAPAPIQAAEPQFVADLRAALDTPGAKVRFHDSNRAVDTADVDISADGMTVHVAGEKEPISVTSLRDILVRGKRIDQTIWEDQGQFVPGWNVRQGTPEAGEITGPLAGLGQFPDKPQASQNVADFIKNPMHTFTFAMPYQNAAGETLYRPVKVNGNLVMATDATANRLSIKGSKSIPDGMVDANSLLRVERNADRLGEQGETLYENTDLAGMVAASRERARPQAAGGIASPAEPKPIDTSLYFGRKLYRQLNEVTGNQEEADALFRLVQARAEALGEDVDRFVARHGLEVQKALGQAQTVAEAQEILTAAQGKKPTREAARAKLREAKQAQTEALANVPAEKPDLEQIQQAEFFYNTKPVQNANQKLSAGTEKTKNEVLAEFRRDVRKRGIKRGRDTAEDLGISGWYFKKDATDSWDQVVQEGKAMGLVPGDMNEFAALEYLLKSPLTIKQSMDDAYYFQALSKPAQDAWTFYGGPDNAVSSLKRHISAMRKVGKDPSGWQALVDEFQRVGNSVAPDPDAQPQPSGNSRQLPDARTQTLQTAAQNLAAIEGKAEPVVSEGQNKAFDRLVGAREDSKLIPYHEASQRIYNAGLSKQKTEKAILVFKKRHAIGQPVLTSEIDDILGYVVGESDAKAAKQRNISDASKFAEQDAALKGLLKERDDALANVETANSSEGIVGSQAETKMRQRARVLAKAKLDAVNDKIAERVETLKSIPSTPSKPTQQNQPIETAYSSMQDSDGTWMVLRGKETISRGWKDQAQAEQVIAAEREDENNLLFQKPEKVKPKTGEPISIPRVYHGSPTPISNFEQRDTFFTDSKEVAEGYTLHRGMWRSKSKSPSISEASLSLNNPLVIDARGQRNDNIPVPWQKWQPKVFGNLPKDAVNMEKIVKYAKENGHDGVVIQNVMDSADIQDRKKSTVYVAFDPQSQVQAQSDPSTLFQGQESNKSPWEMVVDGLAKRGYKEIDYNDPRAVTVGGTKYQTFESPDGARVVIDDRPISEWNGQVNIGRVQPGVRQVTLSAVLVDPESRGKSIGRKATQDVFDSAAEAGADVLIEPAPLAGTPKALNRQQLTDFYKRMGAEGEGAVLVKKAPKVGSSTSVLQQGPKGSIEFLKDGRTIIKAFESADVSTIAHELGHVFRRDISGPDLAAAEQWAGVKNGVWDTDAEEKFARGFERYLRNGKAPTPELRTVFQKFRDWLHNIYQTLRGTSLAVNMTPEMIAVYDNMFKPQGKGVVANEKQGQRQGRQEVLDTGRGAEIAPSPATVPPVVTAAQVPPQPMVEAVPQATPQPAPMPPSTPSAAPSGNAPAQGGVSAPPQPPTPPTAPQEAILPGADDRNRANPGMTNDVRQWIIRERNADPELETRPFAQAQAEADMLDPAVVAEKVKRGESLSDSETWKARDLINQAAIKAFQTGSDEDMRAASELRAGYDAGGTQQGRDFASRRDSLLTPEQRQIEVMNTVFFQNTEKSTVRLNQIAEKLKRPDVSKRERFKLEKERDGIVKREAARRKKIYDKMVEEGYPLKDPDALKDPDVVASIIRRRAPENATKWDKAHELWLASVLGNPATQTANVLGNTMNATWDFTVQRMAEAMINTFAQNETGAQWGEFKYLVKGMKPGYRRAVRNMLQSWRTELPAFESQVGGPHNYSKIETLKSPAIGGIKGRVIRAPLRALMAMDEFSKSLTAEMEAHAQAYRSGKAQGLKGDALAAHIAKEVGDLQSDAWRLGVEKAEELTFQAELGRGGKAIMYGRDAVSGARYIIPFVRTPINIFKTGLAKTPLGTLRVIQRMAMDKEYTGRILQRDVAQQAIAWAMAFGLGEALGLFNDEENGELPFVTGTIPYVPGKQGAREIAMGAVPPMSIRLGDTWVSYARIEPIATMLGTTVDLINNIKQVKNGRDATAALGAFYSHFISQAKDKTFLRGLGDIIDATENPKSLASWASNFAASWVPNSVRAGLGATEGTIKETNLAGDLNTFLPKMAGRTLERMAPGQPLMPQRPKINLWGEEVTKDNGKHAATDWLYRLTIPLQTVDLSERNPLALQLDRAILNWNNANPDETFAPQRPSVSYQVTEKGKEKTKYWTDAQYEVLSRRTGEIALDALEKRADKINFDKPTAQQIKMIRMVLEDSRARAKRQVLRQAE